MPWGSFIHTITLSSPTHVPIVVDSAWRNSQYVDAVQGGPGGAFAPDLGNIGLCGSPKRPQLTVVHGEGGIAAVGLVASFDFDENELICLGVPNDDVNFSPTNANVVVDDLKTFELEEMGGALLTKSPEN